MLNIKLKMGMSWTIMGLKWCFIFILWEDLVLSDRCSSFCHTRGTWLLWLGCQSLAVILPLQAVFLCYLIDKAAIFWACICPLLSSTHSGLFPRLHRALWLDFFRFLDPIVSLDNSKIHDALVNTLTSVSKAFVNGASHSLFYPSHSLLWSCSRLYNHTE